jgi:fluoride ion exporter CrcB/FEX
MILELHTMLQRNELLALFTYLTASIAGGFACFYAGFTLLRILRGYP